PHWLDGVDQGIRLLLDVQRSKGRGTLVRPDLDRRSQGARHPRQRVESRLHQYARPSRICDGSGKAAMVASVPLGRLATPEDLGKAAVFLASDDSAYVTGIELFVDGAAAQI